MNVDNIVKFIKTYKIPIIMTFVVIIGIYLRFKGLTFQSLWLDEIHSVKISNPSRSFLEVISTILGQEHPPLYFTLLWSVFKIFGYTEFVGRAFSAFLGSFAIISIYFLGKTFFKKEVGLYAAIITALNMYLIYYSQDVRSYSMLFSIACLSYMYFLRSINNFKTSYFILYLLSTVALIYTHHYSLVLVATQGIVFLYLLIDEKNNRKRLLIFGIITALTLFFSYLPMLQSVVENIKDVEGGFWITKPKTLFLLESMYRYSAFSGYLNILFYGLFIWGFILFLKYYRHSRHTKPYLILLLWVFFSFSIPYVKSIISTPIIHHRYMTITIPAMILLVAFGISKLKSFSVNNIIKIDTLYMKGLVVFVIVFFSFFSLYKNNYYGKIKKEAIRHVLYEIQNNNFNIPMYDVLKGSLGIFRDYSKFLNLDFNIMGGKELMLQYKNNNIPSCFIILARNNHYDEVINEIKILQDKNIKLALNIYEGPKAKAYLFANDVKPDVCRERYYSKN